MVATSDLPISYDVDQDKKFRAAMMNAAASGLDLSFSMGEAVRIIKKESTRHFILKGFGKYPPLSPAYFKKKLKFGAPPILTGINGGKLKNSIIGTTEDTIALIGKRSLEYGTKALSKKGAPYPAFVQEGTSKMPSRKFLFFSQAMIGQIQNTIKQDIKNQL